MRPLNSFFLRDTMKQRKQLFVIVPVFLSLAATAPLIANGASGGAQQRRG
jgi:hypothetical protein